jgi:lipid II:glycine glycyltransferase (peptidoglycan interpeptide bridge formation enzyme)
VSYKAEFVAGREAWNELVFSMGDSDLVQSYEWGEFRRWAGFKPYRVAVRNGDQIGALSNILVARVPLGVLMYAPHGPVLVDSAAIGSLMNSIRDLALETGAILFRACAPNSAYPLLREVGFRAVPDKRIDWDTGRRVDVVLDLTGSLEDLRLRLRKKTRQYLERSIKRGVEYTSSLDPERLYSLLHKNAVRVGFSIPPLGYYQALCEAYAHSRRIEIWFATYQGEDVAGLLTITEGRIAHLLSLGLDLEHYDNLKPGYGIYWHAITAAHERGCTSVNWGTCNSDQPPREGDKGHSLYWFKSGFGCQLRLVRHYGDLVFKPLRYRCLRVTERSLGSAPRRFYRELWLWPRLSAWRPGQTRLTLMSDLTIQSN